MSDSGKRKPNKWLVKMGLAFVGIGAPTAVYLTPLLPEAQAMHAPLTPLTPDEIRAEFAGLKLAMGEAMEKRVAIDSNPKDEDAARQAYETAVNGMAKHVGKLEGQGREQLARLFRQLNNEASGDLSKEAEAYREVVNALGRLLGDRRIDVSPPTEQMRR
jgi:hypothetical protein